MEKIELQAKKREVKAVTPKKLRKQGLIPAVLYGHNVSNVTLTINANEFERVLRKAGESTIVNLTTDDGKMHPVLIHEVQVNPVTSATEHVDFYEVNMTEKLTAQVVLEFVGESQAIKALGGTLVKILSEVEVECLPADLPHNIEVDISSLNTFDDSILVKDLKVSGKVTVITDGEETVVKVQPPRDVEAELAEPVVEDVSAVVGAAEDKPAAEGEAADESKEGAAKSKPEKE